MMRVRVLTAMLALQKAGLTQPQAAKDIARKYPRLRQLMTRGKDLPDTIMRWRRELEEAKTSSHLAEFSVQMLDAESMLAPESRTPDAWRQFAYAMVAGISLP
jgi:hypothetical protein